MLQHRAQALAADEFALMCMLVTTLTARALDLGAPDQLHATSLTGVTNSPQTNYVKTRRRDEFAQDYPDAIAVALAAIAGSALISTQCVRSTANESRRPSSGLPGRR
jgi:hypothetical protein